jgi:hypothetical protein
MTNRTREIFDFAQNEPDSAFDVEQMVKDCDPDELKYLEKISGNLANAVRNVKAKRALQNKRICVPAVEI